MAQGKKFLLVSADTNATLATAVAGLNAAVAAAVVTIQALPTYNDATLQIIPLPPVYTGAVYACTAAITYVTSN